ncbi:MAG TPA: NAD-dependent epimerase/dehydratase family protein [Candidatus Dormibacteraeota bacterium]
MNTLVIGASEYAGRHALRALPEARAVDPDGDLEAAASGAEVVIVAAPTWDAGTKLRVMRQPHPLLPRVLGACSQAGVRRLVHLSSALVYGADHPEAMALTEASEPRPVHAYEKLKRREEEWLRLNRGALELVVVRPATGFGGHDRLLARLLAELEGGHLKLPEAGRVPHSFLAGPDLGRALAAAAQRGRPGATYLVSGFEGTWRELLEAAAAVLGVAPRIGSVPYDLAYLGASLRELRTAVGSECWPSHLSLDLLAKPRRLEGGRSRRELTWSPQVGSFAEGVAELAAWYRSLAPAPQGVSTSTP